MESSASLSLSASKDFGTGQITLSPRFQSKGMATLYLSDTYKASKARKISSTLRPTFSG